MTSKAVALGGESGVAPARYWGPYRPPVRGLYGAREDLREGTRGNLSGVVLLDGVSEIFCIFSLRSLEAPI